LLTLWGLVSRLCILDRSRGSLRVALASEKSKSRPFMQSSVKSRSRPTHINSPLLTWCACRGPLRSRCVVQRAEFALSLDRELHGRPRLLLHQATEQRQVEESCDSQSFTHAGSLWLQGPLSSRCAIHRAESTLGVDLEWYGSPLLVFRFALPTASMWWCRMWWA